MRSRRRFSFSRRIRAIMREKKKKNNKEKAIFEIIPRASKIEYKTRVKKEEVTNYFYYSIELALVLCNKNYIQIISL